MGKLIKTPNAPYYDDFEQAKKFLRVLFRPSLGVQTRELNQLQTILNDQISSFADFFFQDGQKITGGEVSISNKAFLKLSAPLTRTDDSLYEGATIKNAGETMTGVIAKIVRAEGSDPDTIYIEYASVDSVNSSKTAFANSEELIITLTDASIENVVAASSGASGFGTLVSVLQGIYYISGQFVSNDPQTAVVSKYEITPDGQEVTVGFELVERIITPEEDTSLLDNALGTPNETAPGAHRLTIGTELKRIEEVSNLEKFIKIVSLKGTTVVSQTRETDFTTFEEILAKRTYEESGDYIIDDFLIEVRESFDNGSNRGLSPTGDTNKLGIILDPGKAYVRGYEVVTTTPTTVEINKARTTDNQSELLVSGGYESAFIITVPTTVPALFSQIQLKQGGTVIGTAYVRGFTFEEQELGIDRWRLDFFNPVISVSGKSIADVDNLASAISSFTATVVATDYNPQNVTNIFPIPFGFIQNVADVDLDYVREYNGTVNGTDLPITCAVNDQFQSSIDSYVVVIGSQVERPVSVTRSAGNTQATLNVSNFGAVNGQTGKVYAVTTRNGAIPRFKNLTEVVESKTAAPSIVLNKVDGQSITSIKIGTVDYTNFYTLDGGQRDTHYDYARLNIKAGFSVPVGTLEITYKYFEHGSGDFFAPQSYENITYEEIPYYTDAAGERLFLGSVLDFRPRISSATAYELAGAQTLAHDQDIRTTFAYYLARKDKVCLDRTGKFAVVAGVPSATPEAPADLDAAITLYELDVPAYTFSAQDVRATKFNLRRYTMKDIGRIDTRVGTLEYVSALSLLEADANQRELVDKFKSGFIVDNFKTEDVGDVENDAHEIGFDVNAGEMRPENISESVQMAIDASQSSGYQVTNGAITLPYTEGTEIKQLLASSVIRLQPYTLFNFIGTAKLEPSQDVWVSTATAPDIVIRNDIVTVNPTINMRARAFRRRFAWWQPKQLVNLTSSTRETISTSVEFTPVPFIRSRELSFTGFGLKPFSKVTPYFDGVNVSAYVAPTGGNFGDPLVIGGSGSISGKFKIPNSNSIRFRTGRRKFLLTDGSIDPASASSYAEVFYFADGTLKTTTNTVLQTNRITITPVRKVDPLAQSFSIDKAGGSFVTSIDVYFGPEAESTNAAVMCEIRGMTNGFPNEDLIARKILDSVVGSEDATVATKFTFDSPVYLEQDVEYCFVLLSNSLTITAWAATLGEKSRRAGDTGQNTGQIISKQPFIGSLFKSQNNITWTPEQTSDLKFQINTAQFSTGTQATVVFQNLVPDSDIDTEADQHIVDLEFDPYEFTSGSTTVRVYQENHSFRIGDSVMLDGDASGTLNGVPIAQIHGTKTVTGIGSDFYTIAVTTAATSTGRNGGGAEFASNMVEFSTAYLNAENITLNQTNLGFSLKAFNRTTNGMDPSWFPIQNKTLVPLDGTRVVKASGDKTALVRAQFSTSASHLSPVITANAVNLVCTKNRINNEAESLTTNSGALARYLQRSVTLVNPANEITVYADVNRPTEAAVEVYYKVGQADAEEQATWVQLPAFGVQASTGAYDEFKEYKWTVTLPAEFFVAKVKIVLKSSNEAKIPRVKNLRILYLNT